MNSTPAVRICGCLEDLVRKGDFWCGFFFFLRQSNPIVDGCNHLWSEVRKEESWLPEELALTEGPIRRRRPLPGQRSQGP